MRLLSQIDPAWAHKTIGNTQFTIGRWGCTVTSLCMLLSKFHPGMHLNPPQAAKQWTFTNNAEIWWSASDFKEMKFRKRGYGNNHDEIFNAANQADSGVILEVNRSHWIVIADIKDGQYVVHDPIDGSRHEGIPEKYYITGYAIFDKVQVESDVKIPDWGKKAVDAAKKHGIDKWSNPNEVITPQLVEWIMKDLGVDKVESGSMTKLELIVCLYRLGIFD